MNLRKFGLITLIAALGTTAFGASIDHIQNYTAEYNANMAQQAAIALLLLHIITLQEL